MSSVITRRRVKREIENQQKGTIYKVRNDHNLLRILKMGSHSFFSFFYSLFSIYFHIFIYHYTYFKQRIPILTGKFPWEKIEPVNDSVKLIEIWMERGCNFRLYLKSTSYHLYQDSFHFTTWVNNMILLEVSSHYNTNKKFN